MSKVWHHLLNMAINLTVPINGSKFKAVNNQNNNCTQFKIKARLDQIDTSIDRYLKQIASSDRFDTPESKDKHLRLQAKIEKLKNEINKLDDIKIQLENTPDKQISLTDPDARSMATSTGKWTGIVDYNVQTAVDTKHHIIISLDVTNKHHNESP